MKNWCFWAVVLEKTLESPLDCKEIKPVHPKGNQTWVFIGKIDAEAEAPNTLAIWWEELTHWKRPWCWERLKAGGEGDNKGWDGWMASPTQWTWVWARSRRWWWTGKPDVVQSMGLQRVEPIWATEKQHWQCLDSTASSSHTGLTASAFPWPAPHQALPEARSSVLKTCECFHSARAPGVGKKWGRSPGPFFYFRFWGFPLGM